MDQPSLLMIPLPPPPATVLLVVDMYRIQSAEFIPKARARLRELGYETVLVLADTSGVKIMHEGQPVSPLTPVPIMPVPCPSDPPHDTCALCKGRGLLDPL